MRCVPAGARGPAFASRDAAEPTRCPDLRKVPGRPPGTLRAAGNVPEVAAGRRGEARPPPCAPAWQPCFPRSGRVVVAHASFVAGAARPALRCPAPSPGPRLRLRPRPRKALFPRAAFGARLRRTGRGSLGRRPAGAAAEGRRRGAGGEGSRPGSVRPPFPGVSTEVPSITSSRSEIITCVSPYSVQAPEKPKTHLALCHCCTYGPLFSDTCRVCGLCFPLARLPVMAQEAGERAFRRLN